MVKNVCGSEMSMNHQKNMALVNRNIATSGVSEKQVTLSNKSINGSFS